MKYFLKLKKVIKSVTNYLKDREIIFIYLNKYNIIIIIALFKQ